MSHISGLTLMMAIQAVHSKINDIEEQLGAHDAAGAGDLERLLLSYERALQELRDGYEEIQRTASHLPPYQKLVDH